MRELAQEAHVGRCFTCGGIVPINITPVLLNLGPGKGWQSVSPRFAAPLICGTCRTDSDKLKTTRLEMFKYIGRPKESEGFDG